MNALSLFSGIGGIDLACEWAGIKTVAFCEREPFCQKVLRKHWPDTPIYDDVCTLTKERLEADGIGTIDLIHGGYPCQPFSVAGERKGEDDDRHLWPEVKRLLETIRPRWFVGENVTGHITMGLDEVLSNLEDIGYTVQPFIIPASAIGASHRRDRLFIVANSNGIGRLEQKGFTEKVQQSWNETFQREKDKQPNVSEFIHSTSTHGSNTNSEHVEGSKQEKVQGKRALQGQFHTGSIEEWSRRCAIYQPKLLRTFNGIPEQVDRIKSLGNAVVPAQIYPILAAIKQIDDLLNERSSQDEQIPL